MLQTTALYWLMALGAGKSNVGISWLLKMPGAASTSAVNTVGAASLTLSVPHPHPHPH